MGLAEECVANIKGNDYYVTFTIDPSNYKFILLYHLVSVGRTIKNNEVNLVALNSFDSQASIIQFPTATHLFEDKFFKTVTIPNFLMERLSMHHLLPPMTSLS